jgi:hypothetical protein
MARDKRERILAENGFWFDRHARHGQFWSDGVSTIMIGGDHERQKQVFERRLRKALEARAKHKGEGTEVRDPVIVRREAEAQKPLKASIGEAMRRIQETEDRVAPFGIVPTPATLVQSLEGRGNKTVTFDVKKGPVVKPTPKLAQKLAPPVPNLAPPTQTVASPSSHLLENRRVMVVPEKPKAPKVKDPRAARMDPEVRYLLFLRVQELLKEEGCTVASITRVLQNEGARAASGGPLDSKWVGRVIDDIRAGRMMKDPSTAPPPTTPVAPELPAATIVVPASAIQAAPAPLTAPPTASVKSGAFPAFSTAILSEASLDPAQRLELLRIYMGWVPHPPLVGAILSDPSLTPAQVYKMLEAYTA